LHQTQQRVGALDDLVLIELIGGRVVDGLSGPILSVIPIRQRHPALRGQLFCLATYLFMPSLYLAKPPCVQIYMIKMTNNAQ